MPQPRARNKDLTRERAAEVEQTGHFPEQMISSDDYPSIFVHQVEAIVYTP